MRLAACTATLRRPTMIEVRLGAVKGAFWGAFSGALMGAISVRYGCIFGGCALPHTPYGSTAPLSGRSTYCGKAQQKCVNARNRTDSSGSYAGLSRALWNSSLNAYVRASRLHVNGRQLRHSGPLARDFRDHGAERCAVRQASSFRLLGPRRLRRHVFRAGVCGLVARGSLAPSTAQLPSAGLPLSLPSYNPSLDCGPPGRTPTHSFIPAQGTPNA